MADQDFEALAALEEISLLEDIGRSISAGPEFRRYKAQLGALSSRMSRSERMRAMAENWIRNNKQHLHRIVCENEKIRSALSASPKPSIETFKLLVDALAAAAIYIPAGSLAMLIMRMGAERFCGEERS